jgi:hypothetical protein
MLVPMIDANRMNVVRGLEEYGDEDILSNNYFG